MKWLLKISYSWGDEEPYQYTVNHEYHDTTLFL